MQHFSRRESQLRDCTSAPLHRSEGTWGSRDEPEPCRKALALFPCSHTIGSSDSFRGALSHSTHTAHSVLYSTGPKHPPTVPPRCSVSRVAKKARGMPGTKTSSRALTEVELGTVRYCRCSEQEESTLSADVTALLRHLYLVPPIRSVRY